MRGPFETKKDYIFHKLKQQILDGEYEPGDRLKIRPLAQEFGTSEIPVREAINQLASTGLVTMTPHVGAVATPISAQDLREIFQIRTVLEGLATELAVPNLPPDGIAEIRRIQTELEAAVDGGCEPDRLNRLNRAFHMTIYRHSQNRRLSTLIEELWNHAGRYPAPLKGSDDDSTRLSIREHQQILEALEAHDVRRATELTAHHKSRSMRRVIAIVEGRERLTRSG